MSRPRSHSMPSFHPDQNTPVLRQIPRRRSVYQSLSLLNPLDLLHLHRDKVHRETVRNTRPRKDDNHVTSPMSPAKGLKPGRLGFIARRRQCSANRPVIHQTKIVIREEEEDVETEGLPSYDTSITQNSCTYSDDIETATVCNKPSIKIIACSTDDLTAATASHQPTKDNINEASSPPADSEPIIATASTVEQTNREPKIENPIPEMGGLPLKPFKMPFYGSEPCCQGYHPPRHDMGWSRYNPLRSQNTVSQLIHPTHCPRLTGQCCKCGNRARCRHLFPSWFVPQNIVSSITRYGRYPGDIDSHASSHSGFGLGEGVYDERDMAERFIRLCGNEGKDDQEARGVA
ncbi:hypothetical protein ABW20_dc0105891 [Dactylellina cionopaga]|nr:hypothetical protein ABW20_dc0105891 [Dactylellina cionopaga]